MHTHMGIKKIVVIHAVITAGTVSFGTVLEKKDAQPTSRLDSAAFMDSIDTLVKTNFPLAVKENNLGRIRAVQDMMCVIVNTPEQNREGWKDVSPRFMRLQFQLLQALYDMRQRWTRPNPLFSLTLTDRWDMSTKPADIEDEALRKRYEDWLAYREQNKEEVRRAGTLENMFRQQLGFLLHVARDPQYTDMIKETITDKDFLEALLLQRGASQLIGKEPK